MSVVEEPNNFIVLELKEMLRTLGLSLIGNKAEFISRLIETNPSGV